MKYLIYLSLFMFCALQGYGQTNDNDWLLKEYTKLQNENKRLIKDSTNLQNEINSSVSKIDSLKKEFEALNKVINQPEYHDFYGEKKDPSKVMCIYDGVWAREKVAVESLSPMQWSRAFKSREICKNFFSSPYSIVDAHNF